MRSLAEITAWLNATYPRRDWNQECQRLVWNVIWFVSGVLETEMHTYPTATAARLASQIVSRDPALAPPGAIHYWRHPADGHVGVSLGAGLVLMTGTEYALGAGGVLLGSNYGSTTVQAYTERKQNPYMGWSHTNGANAYIIDLIGDPPPEKKAEDEMTKPLLAQKLDGGAMHTLGVMIDPDGTVTALDRGQYEFWLDRAKCVPIECKNPGHWEYLMGVMAERRKRANVTISTADLERFAQIARDLADADDALTVAEVAAQLQVVPKA